MGFCTYCLSPQTHCLNALFYLTSSRWIWKAYNKSSQIAQFLQINFAHIFANEFSQFQFILNKHLDFKNFENVFPDLNSPESKTKECANFKFEVKSSVKLSQF